MVLPMHVVVQKEDSVQQATRLAIDERMVKQMPVDGFMNPTRQPGQADGLYSPGRHNPPQSE